MTSVKNPRIAKGLTIALSSSLFLLGLVPAQSANATDFLSIADGDSEGISQTCESDLSVFVDGQEYKNGSSAFDFSIDSDISITGSDLMIGTGVIVDGFQFDLATPLSTPQESDSETWRELLLEYGEDLALPPGSMLSDVNILIYPHFVTAPCNNEEAVAYVQLFPGLSFPVSIDSETLVADPQSFADLEGATEGTLFDSGTVLAPMSDFPNATYAFWVNWIGNSVGDAKAAVQFQEIPEDPFTNPGFETDGIELAIWVYGFSGEAGVSLVEFYNTLYIADANGVRTSAPDQVDEPIEENEPSPITYSGPIITDIGEDQTASPYSSFSGETVRVDGNRLSSVTKVFIDSKEGTVVSTADDHFMMIVPDGLTAGTYDLVVQSTTGNLTYLDAFVFTDASANFAAAKAVCDGVEPSWWTQRISDTEAKAYIKCPAVGQKYRIMQQTGGSGSYDSIFAKTLTNENDSTQVFNEFGRYIVRTIDLEDINRIRIRVDDVELWKVRYNQ